MRWFKQSSNSPTFDWKTLTTEDQFFQLMKEEVAVIFKHSTRCSISSMAKSRVEREWKNLEIPLHLLDLIQFREVSNSIAVTTGVEHQSPQLIVFNRGQVVYHASHNAISADAALSALETAPEV